MVVAIIMDALYNENCNVLHVSITFFPFWLTIKKFQCMPKSETEKPQRLCCMKLNFRNCRKQALSGC